MKNEGKTVELLALTLGTIVLLSGLAHTLAKAEPTEAKAKERADQEKRREERSG